MFTAALLSLAACSGSKPSDSIPSEPSPSIDAADAPDASAPNDASGVADVEIDQTSPADAESDATTDSPADVESDVVEDVGVDVDAAPPVPTCTDGLKNGAEGDVDCGGTCPKKCGDGLGCAVDADCTSTFCHPTTTKCTAPACDDTFKNGTETDKDCGGSCTTKCADTLACSVGADCVSGSCNATALKCEAPACSDGVKNGDETDKDCGGTCATKCADTNVCKVDADCQSTFCHPSTLKCIAAACDDTFKNGDETDTDCGGTCPTKCVDTNACKVDGDCQSTFCNPTTTKCAAPACDDTFKNGTETDTDCGGACPNPCADAQGCATHGDCTSAFCNPSTNKCATPGCGDGFKNANETDTDCGGGTCAKCADTLVCGLHADCTSNFCNPGALKCATPACNDGYQNGTETDQDCGGACSTKCGAGLGCSVAGDCQSGVCADLQCASPACDDGVKNGTETGVDCGGSCKNCPTTVPTVGDAPTLKDLFGFLYTGANAVQKNVTATFDPVRFAIVRGRVLDRAGDPISGVTLSIKGRPEFGTTTTQPDGTFDMAVNGGGGMTLEYRDALLLGATRVIDVPWHDFVSVDDVVLVPLDSAVTAVDFTAPVTSHQGTKQTDDAGDRQATLFFTAGTTATMTLPNGTTQPLTPPIHVRATEYTVGPNGPAAMPAELPPSSGYTYAVEFSVDEALAVGATRVDFSKPVVTYVDNFLQFKVGSKVPSGAYERDKGAWVGSGDGRVVRIESITDGKADLVVDKAPAGVANGATLAALGITDDERAELAQKFAVGKELWRVVVNHFTPWDYNWPYAPESGAKLPRLNAPTNPNALVADCENCDGSVIEAQNQTLGETLPLVGTSEALHYRSDRSRARLRTSLTIPITESSVPASLRRIEVKTSVAGRTFAATFSPPFSNNQTYTFNWDGYDAWGRGLDGAYKAKIKVSHVYKAVYTEPASFGESFARLDNKTSAGAGGGPSGIIERDKTRGEIMLSQAHEGVVEAGDHRRAGMGGWSLSSHHRYLPENRELLFGDGRRRMADAVTQSVVNFAYKTGTAYAPRAWALAPDGSAYFRNFPEPYIVKVSPTGAQSWLVGTGTSGCGAAGAQSSATQITNLGTLAVSPDGLLYFTEHGTNCLMIRRRRADGVVENVTAPSNTGVESGVDGPASAAKLPSISQMVFGRDGTLYIASGTSVDPNNNVRRTGIYTIAPDGVLRRITRGSSPGNESNPYCYMTEQNNVPAATAVWPSSIDYIDVDERGRILFSQQCSIKMIDNGMVTTVAGAGYGPPGPFCAARCAGSLTPGIGAMSANTAGAPNAYSDHGTTNVAWDGRGGFYYGSMPGGASVFDMNAATIRHVTSSGVVEPYAGEGTLDIADNSGVGGRMPAGSLHSGASGAGVIGGMRVGPDGALYVGHGMPNYKGGVLARVSPFLPGFTGSELAVPSDDESVVYVFNAVGRHLRTVSNTNVTLQTFGYDAAGRLTSMTDRNGNVMTIERDGGGNMTAIVAPGGQRNTIALDGNGYLASVTNPAGHTQTLTHSADGLLSSRTDPRGGVHTYEYDGLGYLVKDTDAAGGATTLARAGDGTVTLTRPTGIAVSFKVASNTSKTETRTNTLPSGGTVVTSTKTDAVTTATDPVGDTMTTRMSPDVRYGMSAAFASNLSLSTLLGTVSTTYSRQVSLSNNENPFSLTSQTDAFTVNGRTASSTYTVSTRTSVSQTPGGGGSTRRTTTVFDALLRPTSFTADVGQTAVATTYWPDGNVKTMTQGALSTALDYDASKRLIQRTNALGQKTKLTYDATDRVIAMTLAESTPVAQDLATYQYGYDANGNRTSITLPSGATHAFTFDANDLLTTHTPPGGPATTLSYDAGKRLSKVTHGDGREVTFSFDAAGRLSGSTFNEGTTTRTYVGTTGLVATAVKTPSAGSPQSIAFAYSRSIITGITYAGAANGTYAFTYDAPSAGVTNLWVASRALDGGAATGFTYDADGLTTAEGPFSLTRGGPRGATSAIRIGGTTHWTYGYDTLGRRTSRALNVVSPRYSSSVTYDAASQLTQRVEAVNGASSTTYTYKYDGRGQLTEVKKDGAIVEAYAYDVNGNRTSALVAGSPVATTFDAQDRVVTRDGVAYTYDDAGFLKQRGSDTFTYSIRGELLTATVGANTITYAYDAGGRRVARTDTNGTTQYLYARGSFSPTHSRAPDGTVTEYFYDDAARLYALRRGGVSYFVGTDEVGTPKIIVSAAGDVVMTADYDAWGVPLSGDPSTFDIPHGFAGGLRDPLTALVRFGNRDYEPVSGRWTARDPIGFSGGANLFRYVSNSPVNFADPDGLQQQKLNLFDPQTTIHYSFEKTPDVPGIFRVGGHGAKDSNSIGPEGPGGSTAYEVAARLKAQGSGWQPGMTIVLDVCEAGAGDFAATLARLMRTPVYASPNNVGLLPDGYRHDSGDPKKPYTFDPVPSWYQRFLPPTNPRSRN